MNTTTPAQMHDALCPTRTVGHAANTACWCDEIAKVRADERGRVLREAREAVSRLLLDAPITGEGCCPLCHEIHALNAIDRLVQEAP